MSLVSFDTRFEGTALLTEGLTAFKTIEGLGLITHGFLWPFPGIWSIPVGEDLPTTTWLVPASETVPATGWTNSPDCSVNGFY